MNTKKSLLVGAAISSLPAMGALGSPAVAHAGDTAVGQCHGVNACKGKADCQGKSNECEGKNACKGKGWVKMSKADCEKNPKGHWEAMPEKH
jgi:hypothetical protein